MSADPRCALIAGSVAVEFRPENIIETRLTRYGNTVLLRQAKAITP